MKVERVIKYLNVDLDIYFSDRIDILILELENDMFVVSRDHARVSLETQLDFDTPESAVDHICDLIQNLPDKSKVSWNACADRILSIGVQSGAVPHQVNFIFSENTIKKLCAINAKLAFTVYALE